MLDIKLLRTQPEIIVNAMATRNITLDIEVFFNLEEKRKKIQQLVEDLRAQRNSQSKKIGELKTQQKNTDSLMESVTDINQQLKEYEQELQEIQAQLHDYISAIPNIPHSSVPAGSNEEDNQLVRQWGEPASFEFIPKDHISLGELHGILDFDAGARIAGSRFVVMHGMLARLHRALIQFMLDIHTNEHGYQEVNVPYMVNPQSCFGTGQLPKFAEDLFFVEKQSLYLIPTAEVPVTNIFREQILDSTLLPIKMVCHSPCFRSEAGSYGRDVRGMIRQHQFEKVELVQFTTAEDSWDSLESLTADAEHVLQRLQLPYRVVTLCGGDLGFSAAKTYDLEVWLPAQQTYREISSCSNFIEFQARRMQMRYRDPRKKNKTQWVHTLNGSGLAVGRTLIAILENYQDAQGNIHIPQALHPYMGGITCIKS